MAFKIKPKDAAILEDLLLKEARHKRTEKIFNNLPNRRTNRISRKLDEYKKLEGQIAANRYNEKLAYQKIIKKIYGYNSKEMNIADAMVRG